MKLSSEISVGLKRLSSGTLISDDVVDLLLAKAKSLGIPNEGECGLKDVSALTRVDVIKEGLAALCCLFTEAVRNCLEPSELSTFLEGYRFSSNRISKIVHTYTDLRSPLLHQLQKIKTEVPTVCDVHWKLYYCTKSSFSSLEGKPLFIVDLVIDCGTVPDSVNKISFICTVQHLQELVAKLKAAVRQLESIAAITK